MIGLLLPNFENPIFPTIAQALQARTAASGYASILCTTESAAFREVEYVHMPLDRKVEGMIFVSCEMTNLSGEHDHYARLLDDGARIVFVNGALNRLDIPSVGVDERPQPQLAAQHLLDLGHTRIAFASGPEHYLRLARRKPAGAGVMAMRGFPPTGRSARGFDVEAERGPHGLLARHEPRLTGIICSNDLMAIGVLQAAGSRASMSRVISPSSASTASRRLLDEPGAHHDRAADRRDRADGSGHPADPDRGPEGTPELLLPPQSPHQELDRTTPR